LSTDTVKNTVSAPVLAMNYVGNLWFKTFVMDQTLPFSESIESNGAVYISGQIGVDPATNTLPAAGFAAEADQVMKNLGSVLHRQGLDYGDLVNVTIYLKSMENYSAANTEYRKYFSGRFPARVCIAVHDLPLNANIEIAGIARRKK